MSEVVGLIARGGYDGNAPLYGINGRTLFCLPNSTLGAIVGAVE